MSSAKRFYEEIFEFKEDFICDEHEIFLRNASGFVLGLEQVEEPEVLPKWFHFGFDAMTEEKLRSTFNKVSKSSYTIRREIRDFGDTVNFYCSDPDGTQIEVYFNRR